MPRRRSQQSLVFEQEAWMAEGACRWTSPELFFPVGKGAGAVEQTARARAVCMGCTVRALCAEYALRNRIDHGVWGATSPGDRRSLRRRARS